VRPIEPSSAEQSLRVLIVDDHPIWRDAVARDLEDHGFTVVGTAADVAGALRVLPATRPDVVLCDLSLPDGSGADVISQVVATSSARVLVLSASAESGDVLDAVKAGASGYLTKSAQPHELRDALLRTAAGEAVYTPGLAALVLGEYRRLDATPGATTPQLTAREEEMLRLVAKGLTSRQVAERLVLSPRTVQNHIQNAMSKLQVHNRASLVRYVIENLD
jgi:DNA-binding NarL/FixJ family response regulator